MWLPHAPAVGGEGSAGVANFEAATLGQFLNPIIKANGLDGAFFLQCAQDGQEDLRFIGIGQVQWKKIRTYMPQ